MFDRRLGAVRGYPCSLALMCAPARRLPKARRSAAGARRRGLLLTDSVLHQRGLPLNRGCLRMCDCLGVLRLVHAFPDLGLGLLEVRLDLVLRGYRDVCFTGVGGELAA